MAHSATSPSLLTSVRLILLTLLLTTAAYARDGDINADESHLAIHGYDPVAYFTAGKPTPGLAKYEARWQKARWRFASEENRKRFLENPRAWAPQYGGHCAYAASYGQFADTDPNAWTIFNGKLYLNYSLHVRDIWKPRAAEFIGDADQLWPTMDKATADNDE